MCMKHSEIFRKQGVYGAFPVLNNLPYGRLTIKFSLSPFNDHWALGRWTVLVSTDEGDTWTKTNDSTSPATWPASNPREQSDRFAGVMTDGTYVCAGAAQSIGCICTGTCIPVSADSYAARTTARSLIASCPDINDSLSSATLPLNSLNIIR